MKTHLQKVARGFTLIELLVVIAIIGVLASVVLASLNSARDKGEDAAVKANLSNIRSQAEIFYDNNGNYTDICTLDANVAAAVAQVTGGVCSSDADSWAAEAPLTTGVFCVDNAGTAGEFGATTYADLVCD